MNSPANHMDYDAWTATFQPLTNPREECLLFDPTEPHDLTFLGHVDHHHVWTEVDMDDGYGTAIIPGRHFVNRVGHLVTMAPWADDQLDLEIVHDPDDFHEGQLGAEGWVR